VVGVTTVVAAPPEPVIEFDASKSFVLNEA